MLTYSSISGKKNREKFYRRQVDGSAEVLGLQTHPNLVDKLLRTS